LPTILCEINPANSSITKKYYYANAQILEQIDINAGAASYYVHDRLGSIRLVIDVTGVKNSYTYNPFGETIDYQQTTDNCFKFTGQYLVVQGIFRFFN